jgi:biopolymer transport protein ExbD
MNFRKKINHTTASFQMTPLIDVVFLILIWFISASIYAKWETKISVKVPTAKTGKYSKRFPGEVIINISNDGKIFMNSIQVSNQRLTKLLKELTKVFPSQSVIIRGDRKTPYEDTIKVLDTCKESGINLISFATVPQDQNKDELI